MADIDLAVILADGEYLKRAGDTLVGDIPATGGSGGTTILAGAGPPVVATGAAGDYYADTTNGVLYGPKQAPVPGSPVLSEPFNDFTTNSWSLYNGGGGNPTIVAGRTGTCARMTSGSEAAYLMAAPARGEYWTFGFAYKLSSFAGQALIVRLQAAGVDQTRLKIDSNGAVLYTQPDGTLLAGSVAGVITANTWHFIEVQTRLHDTLGSVTIRVNGTTCVTGTNKDTRQGATAVYETLRFVEPFGFSGESNYVDDLYLDSSTTAQPAFRGDSANLSLTWPTTIRAVDQTVEAQAGTTYTVVAADNGKLKSLSGTATVTLPSAGPTPGQRVDFVCVGGAATFTLGAGATWHVNPTPSAVARAVGSFVTAVKMGATTWALVGDLA